MAIGKQIRRYRDQLGWTLQQLSEASDVDPGTISALELRDSNRSTFFLPIAKAFGLTLEELADESRVHIAKPPSLTTEPPPTYKLQQYDQWTSEAIEIMAKLDDRNKFVAVALLKAFVQNLMPPSNRPDLSVAA